MGAQHEIVDKPGDLRRQRGHVVDAGMKWNESLLLWPASKAQLEFSGYAMTGDSRLCDCGDDLFFVRDEAGNLFPLSVASHVAGEALYRLHSPAMCRFNAQVQIGKIGRRASVRPGRTRHLF